MIGYTSVIIYMIEKIFKLFSGRHYKKFANKCQPTINLIHQYDDKFNDLTNDQMSEKTLEFKQRVADGESLDNILPEAFALVRNAASRLRGQSITVCEHELQWDMVHYDVQLLGGIALHNGKIAEMATGEGKTLVATLPLYLNALTGKNCQLVTVNDYLARRDSEWMGYLFKFLGMSVGCIQHDMPNDAKKAAYNADVTYGTASEFGFDYLRDNGMTTNINDQVQRGHFFCIVDEVDSILIDEARTPLIISGESTDDSSELFLGLKSSVTNLVNVQQKLCNQLVTEAKITIENGDVKNELAYKKLWQVKLGMPKNRQLMKLMENGVIRKQLERFDLEMNAEANRDKRYELKEELFYVIDEKQQEADLTEKGRNTLCPNDDKAFLLPDLPTIFSDIESNPNLSFEEKSKQKAANSKIFEQVSSKIHCLSQLLRAYSIYNKDEQYAVINNEVVIIDENTGRAMPGRRWSDGLHQAIEAKEGLEIENESKTYATITLQNYFRLYKKLAGMTGTAETEAQEFNDIYKLSVVAIPTNKPCKRIDFNDVIYKTRREKYNAVLEDIKKTHEKGQPILVGTTSVDSSEVLSKMLKLAHIPHNVLNAKYHQQEADIIAEAGRKGAVTIATNMAGRGTDIKLEDGIAELGGLYVIGTERHESRRVDRQLRGRCARQGDNGMSKFYVSLEDNLMRLFAGSGPIANILQKTFKEGEVLEHPLLNKSIGTAQKKVEEYHYSIRKRLLQYDDVLNTQRDIIYTLRNDVLQPGSQKEIILETIEEELDERFDAISSQGFISDDQLKQIVSWANMNFPVMLQLDELKSVKNKTEFVLEKIKAAYSRKEEAETTDSMPILEKFVLLRAIDNNWQNHLTHMDDLRQSVGLRSYGQRDPLSEYKQEAFNYFERLLKQIRQDICSMLFRVSSSQNSFDKMVENLGQNLKIATNKPQEDTTKKHVSVLNKIAAPAEDKIGRNDDCPCGSGKKYKKCCGLK